VLTEGAIDRHNDEAADNMSEYHVASGFGGSLLPFYADASNPYEQVVYTNPEDWQRGLFDRTVVEFGQLVPEKRDDISVAGTWTTIVPLPQTLSNIFGVTVGWQGQGCVVDASLDGITWATVSKGNRISLIPAGFNPVDKYLTVRVTFSGSILYDESFIDDLTITTYGSNTLPPVDGRIVTLTNAAVENSEDIMDYDQNWGAELNNGTVTISATATGSFPVRTIEIWAKKAGSGAFADNLTPTNSYTNGGTLQAYQVDEWQLRTYTFNTGQTGAISFTGTGQIGCVVIYPNQFTAADVLQSYRSYVGRPVTQLAVQGNLVIVDQDALVEEYEFDWADGGGG
jgi:hypothetical protein